MDRLSRVLTGPLRPANVKAPAQPGRVVPSSRDVRSFTSAVPGTATWRDPVTEYDPWVEPASGTPRPMIPVEASMFAPASPAAPSATYPVAPTSVPPPVVPGALAGIQERSPRIAEPPLRDEPKSVTRPAREFRTSSVGHIDEIAGPVRPSQETPELMPRRADVAVARFMSPAVMQPLAPALDAIERPAPRPSVVSPFATQSLASAPPRDGRPAAWRAIPAPPLRSARAAERIERFFERIVAQPLERQPAASVWEPRVPGPETAPGPWTAPSNASSVGRPPERPPAASDQPVAAFGTAGQAPTRKSLESAPRAALQSTPARSTVHISQQTAAVSRPGRGHEHLPPRPTPAVSTVGHGAHAQVAGTAANEVREHLSPRPAPRAPAAQAPSASALVAGSFEPAAGRTARMPALAKPAVKPPATPIEAAPLRPLPAAIRPTIRSASLPISRRALMTFARPSRPAAPASPHRSPPSAAAKPLVSISIGRVEIIAPPAQQTVIPARAHQIDPGLHLGAGMRGRL